MEFLLQKAAILILEGPMIRYKGLLEYVGTPFVGWQRQPQDLSVQECLEKALFKFSGYPVETYASGRTDSGVHALGQVVHFDLEKHYPLFHIRDGINYYLKPYPIALQEVTEAPPNFHARFSAIARSYEYHIINRYAPLTHDVDRAWRLAPVLDLEAMRRGAEMLLGTHDFTSFRSIKCQAVSPIKTLDVFEIYERPGDRIVCFLKARSFLHHQVRNMVGTLAKVGLHRWSLERLQEALQAKDRRKGGPMAPACGLYFYKAYYPEG
jgi:tRNA pseudouridine38-40 synthase